MDLTQAQIDEARKQAMSGHPVICPGCNMGMRILTTEQSKAGIPEAYCESCYLSVPLKD